MIDHVRTLVDRHAAVLSDDATYAPALWELIRHKCCCVDSTQSIADVVCGSRKLGGLGPLG